MIFTFAASTTQHACKIIIPFLFLFVNTSNRGTSQHAPFLAVNRHHFLYFLRHRSGTHCEISLSEYQIINIFQSYPQSYPHFPQKYPYTFRKLQQFLYRSWVYSLISTNVLGSVSGKASKNSFGFSGFVLKSVEALISCTSFIPYIFFALKQ